MTRIWRVRWTAHAEADFIAIATWTAENFGGKQAERYLSRVSLVVEALCDGPDHALGRARDDLAPGVRTLHAGRDGRPLRQFVVYRVVDGETIEVLRLLHERMDLPRHLEELNR
jgi:toxin ParE1/3/4